MQSSITVGDETVKFRLVDDEENVDDMGIRTVSVTVTDPTNDELVAAAVQAEILKRCWYTNSGIRAETLCQAFEIVLGQETTVAVYNFLPRDLTLAEVATIGQALQDFRAWLQKPEYWRVRSIQIRS